MFGFGAEKKLREAQPASIELGYLGKLVSRADYLQHCAGSREVLALDSCLKDWLVLQQSRGQPSLPERGMGFLMVGGLDRQGLCGYLFPSEDSHGRLYPFFYFARWSDVALFFRPAPLFFGSWKLFQSRGEELAWPRVCPEETQVHGFQDFTGTDAAYQGRRLVSQSMSGLAELTLGHWLNHMVGGDPSLQIKMLAGCRSLIDKYRSPVNGRLSEDLSLPLGTPELAPHSLLFWLHLLSGMGAQSLWRPDMVWTLDDSLCRLFVLSKPMTASRLDQLFNPADSPGRLPDWSQADARPHREWATELVSQPEHLMLDVLIRWSQEG